jgi:PAS domain S-box-containing protein
MKNKDDKSSEPQNTTQTTDSQLLNALLDDFPNHIYFKDINSRFIRISKSQAEAFHLSDPSEAIGKSDFDFFSWEHANQVYQDEQQIMQTGESLTKEEKETWPDRPDTWVTTTKTPLRDEKGVIIGTFGISKDITEQKQMEKVLGEEQNLVRALMDNLPDAIYFKDAKSRYIRINQALARWFGLDDPAQAVGKSDFDFYPKESSRQYYNDEQTIMQTGQPLVGKEENQTFPDGRVVWLSVTKVPLRDQEGKIIGTFGISRDITAEKHLRENIEDLQRDVGRTFHTLSATLLQVRHVITPTINTLGPDPFKENYLLPTAIEIWKELTNFRNNLASTISKLLGSIETPFQKEAFLAEDWTELYRLLSIIEEVEKIHIAEQRVPVLRRAAREVIDILDRIKKDNLEQELVREVMDSAEQLERVTCLVALHQMQNRILETDYMVRDLRERVLTGVKKIEKPESCEFWDLVREAMEGLSEYAHYHGVDFKKDNRTDAVCVWVGRTDIIRAINNLLHNAIKYSWWRTPNVTPWIEIRSFIRGNKVCLEIEDYGVPIPRDEIEMDLIFQLGWRGRLAGQRGRIGSGIGLADARDIARHYGGEVEIASRPATHSSTIDDLSVPHIVTATLELPIYTQKGS